MKFWKRRTLRVKELILEDNEGKERAVLRTDSEQNTVLQFKDASGTVRMFLELSADGTPQIMLKYAGGKGSIQIEANDRQNCAGILIAGPNGKSQVVLGVAENGEPRIGLVDEEGQLQFHRIASRRVKDAPTSFDWDNILRP